MLSLLLVNTMLRWMVHWLCTRCCVCLLASRCCPLPIHRGGHSDSHVVRERWGQVHTPPVGPGTLPSPSHLSRGWNRNEMALWHDDSMDMNWSKLQEIVKDRKAWHVALHGVAKGCTWLSNEAYDEVNTHEPNQRLKSWSITSTFMFLPVCSCVPYSVCPLSPQSKHDIQFYVDHSHSF